MGAGGSVNIAAANGQPPSQSMIGIHASAQVRLLSPGVDCK